MSEGDVNDKNIYQIVAVIRNDVHAMKEAARARAMREWGVIASAMGLIGTIALKALGWL